VSTRAAVKLHVKRDRADKCFMRRHIAVVGFCCCAVAAVLATVPEAASFTDPDAFAASVDAAPGGSGLIVFASNRDPNLNVAHRYVIRLDGRGRRRIRSLVEGVSPDGRFRARTRTDAGLMTIEITRVATGRSITVALPFGNAVWRIDELVWSPNSRWLAIQACPHERSCAPAFVFVVHPDGTGLHEVAEHANDPVWAPDSRRIAYSGYVGSDFHVSVARVDLGASTILGIGADPAWSPRGSVLAYNGPKGILVVDFGRGSERLLKHIFSTGPPLWAPNGRELAFLSYFRPCRTCADFDRLHTIRVDGTEAHVVGQGRYLSTAAWSPDSSRLAFSRETATYTSPEEPRTHDPARGQLFIVRSDGTRRRQVTHERPWADFENVAWARDGRHLVYDSGQSDNDRELYVMDGDGQNTRQLTHDLFEQVDPSWSPDATQVVFARVRHYGVADKALGLYRFDLRTKRQVRLTKASYGDISPAWSPTADEIVFVRSTIGPGQTDDQRYGYQLLLVNANGGPVKALTARQWSLYSPSWSPDGSTIAFGSASGLYTIRRDGTKLTPIPLDRTMSAGPSAWSPNGDEIAFFGTDYSPGRGTSDVRLWIVNVDGTNLHPIANVHGDSLTWSPDGKQLAYDEHLYDAQTRTDISRIHTIRVDGTADTVVAATPLQNDGPDWGPRISPKGGS
jgi:Tol biopolymer transport system component